MYELNRSSMRGVFVESWRKRCAGVPMEPLEAQLADIIGRHPEYHALLSDSETLNLDGDFGAPGTVGNPFLHLSLHSALAEQLATNRPRGIGELYRELCAVVGDAHLAEHAIMECLGELLWNAQSTGKIPDERVYLSKLKKLLK